MWRWSMRALGLLAFALGLMAGGHPPPVLDAPRSRGVIVPAGSAQLGSDEAERTYAYAIGGEAARRGRWFENEPYHIVTLPAYWMDLTLVTQGEYARFVAETGHRAPQVAAADYPALHTAGPTPSILTRLQWRHGRPPGDLLEHPVAGVAADDAGRYCAWRGALERRTCRLPSEDEWEKAARGEDGRYFPWGSTWEPWRLNSHAAGPAFTTPVTAHEAGRSPYGLYDMAGNLFQWTATAGSASETVLKGCSWDQLGGICRAAARHGHRSTSRLTLIGFRCACDVTQDSPSEPPATKN